MMKLKIFAVLAGVVFFAGCGQKAADNQITENSSKETKTVEEKSENQKGVISSIKDAMGLGKTMRCTYKIKDENGEMEAVSYVDGKKYRTDIMVAGKAQHMIFDEESMYSWSEGEKDGMKMRNDCFEEAAKDLPASGGNEETPALESSNDEIFDGATEVQCEETSGIDFSIPGGINFVDQCETMKGMTKNIPNGENLPKGMPGGVPGKMLNGAPEL